MFNDKRKQLRKRIGRVALSRSSRTLVGVPLALPVLRVTRSNSPDCLPSRGILRRRGQ